MVEYVYWDFEKKPISVDRYKLFLHEYYGDSAEERYRRLEWYKKRGNYYLLLALYNGEPVGQSSAYQASARINGNNSDWWWSVDTFVLSRMRGKGIGKGLQKRLHCDFPNFSSLWYSKSNGAIKRICGSTDFLYTHFNFYPVGAFFSMFSEMFFMRYLNRKISFPVLGEYKFYHLNALGIDTGRYIIKEIDLQDNLADISICAAKAQEKFDFYILKDKNYLHWKYIDNPTMGEYHTIAIYSSNSILLGMVIFSGMFLRRAFSILKRVVTVLDCFQMNDSLPKRILLLSVMKYYKTKNVKIDGVLSLQDMNYFPCLRYPNKGVALLSTCKEKIGSFYLSYSDQDMEQMI